MHYKNNSHFICIHGFACTCSTCTCSTSHGGEKIISVRYFYHNWLVLLGNSVNFVSVSYFDLFFILQDDVHLKRLTMFNIKMIKISFSCHFYDGILKAFSDQHDLSNGILGYKWPGACKIQGHTSNPSFQQMRFGQEAHLHWQKPKSKKPGFFVVPFTLPEKTHNIRGFGHEKRNARKNPNLILVFW